MCPDTKTTFLQPEFGCVPSRSFPTVELLILYQWSLSDHTS